MSKHSCHARDCEVEVPPKMLMCGRDWRLVPRGVQRAVWAAFNPKQCAPVPNRPAPSGAWMVAADVAILAVWEMRGARRHPVEEVERQMRKELEQAVSYANHSKEDGWALMDALVPEVPDTLRLLKGIMRELVAPPRVVVKRDESTRVVVTRRLVSKGRNHA